MPFKQKQCAWWFKVTHDLLTIPKSQRIARWMFVFNCMCIHASSKGLKFEPLNHQKRTHGLKFDTLRARYVCVWKGFCLFKIDDMGSCFLECRLLPLEASHLQENETEILAMTNLDETFEGMKHIFHTVDGSEILYQLTCMKPCKQMAYLLYPLAGFFFIQSSALFGLAM